MERYKGLTLDDCLDMTAGQQEELLKVDAGSSSIRFDTQEGYERWLTRSRQS